MRSTTSKGLSLPRLWSIDKKLTEPMDSNYNRQNIKKTKYLIDVTAQGTRWMYLVSPFRENGMFLELIFSATFLPYTFHLGFFCFFFFFFVICLGYFCLELIRLWCMSFQTSSSESSIDWVSVALRASLGFCSMFEPASIVIIISLYIPWIW